MFKLLHINLVYTTNVSIWAGASFLVFGGHARSQSGLLNQKPNVEWAHSLELCEGEFISLPWHPRGCSELVKGPPTFHGDGKLNSAMEVRKRPGPLENVKEVGGAPWGVLVSWPEAREKQSSGHSETASRLPSVGEQVTISALDSGLGCTVRERRRQRMVCRGRKCWLHDSPLLRLGTPPPRARSSPLRALLSPGMQAGFLGPPWPTLFLHELFKCECFLGLSSDFYASQNPHSLRAESLTPCLYLVTVVCCQGLPPAPQPRPFFFGLNHLSTWMSLGHPNFDLIQTRYPHSHTCPMCEACKCHQHPPTQPPQISESRPHFSLQTPST